MSEWLVRYDRSGVPARHKGFRPSDSKSESWSEKYQKIKEVVDKGGLCSLLGKRGTGKTQGAVCAIGYNCRRLERNALYVKAFDVFLNIRNGNSSRDKSEKEAVNEYLKPHLLVIDAFEVRGDTGFENRTLNHIIDKRYDAIKPTILISNETPKDFAVSVGESFMDRMRESGAIIVFDGESRRVQQ